MYRMLVLALALCTWATAQDGGAVQTSEKTDAKTEATAKTKAMTKVEVKGFSFEYRVEGENLEAQVSFKTTGWVSVGFNPTRKMQDGNFIIGYAADGRSVVQDHFGVRAVKHQADEEIGGKNDIVEAKCEEKDGVTTLWFVIPLNSGDSRDVVLEKGGKATVILAAGKKDKFTKHSWLGKTTITL